MNLEHLCSFFHLKFSSIITSLLTSLLLSLPEKGMPVISTLKKKPENLQQVEKLKQQQADVLRLQNVLKSHFPNGIHDNMFVGTEDELGQKHQGFFEAWYVVASKATKEQERKAAQQAFPKCPPSYVESLINKARAVRKHVLKKGKNMKTGILMAPWCKQLLAVLSSGNSALPEKGTGKVSALPVRTSFGSNCSSSCSGSQVKAAADGGPVPCLEKAEESSDSELQLLSQNTALTVASSPASQKVIPLVGGLAEEDILEPEASSAKKPAAKLKRPASVILHSHVGQAWKPSSSFGFLKATLATEKSYIQNKASLSSKPSCLVNVQGKAGVNHHKIIQELLEFAQQAGLTKAQVVEKKNSMLSKSGD